MNRLWLKKNKKKTQVTGISFIFGKLHISSTFYPAIQLYGKLLYWTNAVLVQVNIEKVRTSVTLTLQWPCFHFLEWMKISLKLRKKWQE